MSGSVCKYCNKVELTFDQAFKSKTGKLIPLDKTSGQPHQCAENPYSQPPKQQQQPQEDSVLKLLATINEKLDRVLNLAERK
jgi:hypothetical protein